MRFKFDFGEDDRRHGASDGWRFRRAAAHFKHGGRFRHGFGHGSIRRRGSTKFDILAVLADAPRHGYDIMLELERRSGMRPSPGSIYPALAMLEDGDFVRGRESDGKRIFEITDAGRTMLAERPAHETNGEFEDDERQLYIDGANAVRGLIGACKEAMRSRDASVIKRVVEIIERARRDVYTLLAAAE